jgi:hypothetical protein
MAEAIHNEEQPEFRGLRGVCVVSPILPVNLQLQVLGTERGYPVGVAPVPVGLGVTAQANNRQPMKRVWEPRGPRPVIVFERDMRINRRQMPRHEPGEGVSEWLDVSLPKADIGIEMYPNLNWAPSAGVPYSLRSQRDPIAYALDLLPGWSLADVFPVHLSDFHADTTALRAQNEIRER